MESSMPVVQALDERDLLVKKIMNKTEKAQFLELIRPKAATTWERRETREEFRAEAAGSLQQILDMAARYEKLNAAITMSNALTYLDTSQGKMSVACAIALRNRLRGSGPYGELTDFEGRLVKKLQSQYNSARAYLRKKNEATGNVNRGRTVIVQNKSAAAKTDPVPERRSGAVRSSCGSSPDADGLKDNGGADRGIQGKSDNMLRLYDPLDVRRKAEELQEKRDNLLAELETKIKISNAITYITI